MADAGRRLREIARRNEALRAARRAVVGLPQRAALAMRRGGRGGEAMDPARMVWIFGSGRSGSTWLRSMVGDLPGWQVWEEPLVGRMFGEFYNNSHAGQRQRPDFILADATRRGWTGSIRNFVLDGARYARPGLRPTEFLVIKEPNGSIGAPLLMEALPESRMVLLLRDPRDVISSALDGAKRGNWLHEWNRRGDRFAPASENPNTFVKRRARMFANHVGAAIEAYESHRGPKSLVRYEDLLSDTLATMRRLCKDLSIEVDEKELRGVVERHSWENIPAEQKGEGKFYRKASPGSFSEDLTQAQISAIEEIAGPVVADYYPSLRSSS